MSQLFRTAVFLAVAAVLAVVTFALPALLKSSSRLTEGESLESMVNQPLFPEFKDPLSATSLEITRYNEQTGDQSRFEVAQVGGIWSIPSHENYPADAKDQLAAAAADLIDLKILSVASDKRTDHALYGVVDPTDKGLAPGTPGVGMKVIMKGVKDKALVSMIVGKEDSKTPGVRYVRRTGQDVVLAVKLGTEKLTTDFGEWIEKDLLKLNPWDLNQVFIEDYSVDEAQGHILNSDEFRLAYDGSADPKWKVLANRRFNAEGQWEEAKPATGEELDTARLDAMQTALGDLKIVDVARKPAGMSADLAADKSFLDNREAIESLAERGFYAANVGGKVGIYSDEGEIHILMKNGVEYVLRFGGIAGSDGGTQKTEDGKPAKTEGVNRYLFASVRFNPDAIAKPDIQPLPAAEPEKKEDKAAPPAADAPKKDDAAKPEPAADAKTPADAEGPKTDEPTKDESKKEEPKAEEAKKDEPKPDQPKVDPKQQREAIEKENRRKQEQYDEKIAEGKKQVAQLNARFADWYYVISESVYDKIHLGREEIFKKKVDPKAKPKDDASQLPVQTDNLPPDAFAPVEPK